MARPKLVIGNRCYSSWSLRPWLALRVAGVDFEVERVALYRPESAERLRTLSPTGLVPVLIEGDVTTWESLAICERAAELAPGAGLWPEDPMQRTVARSVATEMHGGFAAIRQFLPMNLRSRARRAPSLPEEVRRQVDRVVETWTSCLGRASGGPFLFGRFGIADAMWAPVATRFHTYRIELPQVARDWCDAVLALPAMREWTEAALAETERMPETDALLDRA
ncbi:glutathione S-transferase family protein [bacterium]|nr:glutathione S-transferase family protein [bacterium]